DRNVVTEAVNWANSYGWGIYTWTSQIYQGFYFNLGTFVFSNNIMTQIASPWGWGLAIEDGYTVTVTNNIFFNWPNGITNATGAAPVTSSTVTFTGYNVQDAGGANNLGAPEPFPNPGRTVGTYYDSIVGSSGHTSFDFIAAARGQSKDNWNPQLMAAAV